MTREEIISNLLYMKHSVKEDTIEDITINEAIKVLQQEPCKDTISREAVIDIIEDVCPIYGNDYRYILRDKVNELPPVTAEKVGHWIEDVDRWGDIVTTVNGYRCSRCNAFNTDKDNYCPNCGAMMQASPTGAESGDK